MRSRNIKPALFKNEILGVIDPLYTILFAGLWCLADREGRLEDRPLRIKAEIFPYREIPDFNGYLTELERLEFICRYTVENIRYIEVVNFKRHQNPHKTEKASTIPENTKKSDSCVLTVKQPLNNGEITEAARLIPDSLIPDSLNKNILCVDGNKKPLNGHARFDEWWTKLPKQMRIAKKRCVEIWRRKHLDDDADELIADVVERMQKDQKWIDGFAPTAPTYLNQERWEDEYQRIKR